MSRLSVRSFSRRLPAVLLAVVMILMAAPLFAATRTWTGAAGDGLWTTPENWQGNAIPGLLDHALFNGPGGDVEVGSASGVSSIQFGATATGWKITGVEHEIFGDQLVIRTGINDQATSGTNEVSCPLYLNSAQQFSVASGSVLKIGNVATGTSTLTLNANGIIYTTGAISGSGALNVTGTGSVTTQGANTYSGGTTVNGATVDQLSYAGLPGGAYTINDGTVNLWSYGMGGAITSLTLNGGKLTSSAVHSPLLLPATITATSSATKSATISIQTKLPAQSTVNVADGPMTDDLVWSTAPIDATGAASITKAGAGRMVFGTANASQPQSPYNGALTLSAGTLVMGHTACYGSTQAGLTATAGTLVLAASPAQGEALVLNGATLSASDGVTIAGPLTLSVDTPIVLDHGSITLTGSILGAGKITSITGWGGFNFFGASTMSSLITASNNGTIGMSGDYPNLSFNILEDVGRTDFTGSGQCGSVTIAAGAVRSLTSINAALRIGNLKLVSNAVVTHTDDTTFNTLFVNGTVDLTAGYLAGHQNVAYVLKVPALPMGQPHTLIANDGVDKVIGTFIDVPEGATVVSANGYTLKVSYVGGDGNDVTLTRVPELAKLSFSPTDYANPEGTSPITLSVTRTGSLSGAVSVNWGTVADSTAAAGSDFVAASGTLNWADGDGATKTFTVAIVNDLVTEPNETFHVRLTNPSQNATFGAAEASVVIQNDDGSVEVDANASTSETGEAGPNPQMWISRVGPATGQISVSYTTVNGTAVGAASGQQGGDFTITSGTLTWADGDASPKVVEIPIREDAAYELDETFQFKLLNPVNTTISGSPASILLHDNDSGLSMSLAPGTDFKSETDGAIGIPVHRFGSATGVVTVKYKTIDGSAKAGTDFEAATGTLTWQNGDGADKQITVNFINDGAPEATESFTVQIYEVTGATIVSDLVTITLDDDDGMVQFASGSYTVNENAGTAVLTVLRTGSAGSLTVSYDTANGTAFGGDDYVAKNGSLSWSDGDTNPKQIVIDLVDNQVIEQSETFVVNLKNPTRGVVVSPSTAEVTIKDDDAKPGTLQFSGATYSVNESQPTVTVTVTRTGGSYGAASVNYATANGTATAGSDYGAASGTLNWADGDAASKTFTVAITNDTATEQPETFTVALSGITGSTLGTPSTATVTIVDNDQVAVKGDFNGDGKADIVWRNYSTGANAFWLMNGTTFSTILDLPAMPNTNYRLVGTADMNADGKTDIVWRNVSTGANAIWAMNGTSVATINDLPALPNAAYAIEGTGDMNGDGKPDIIWRNTATGANSVWLMNGLAIGSVADLPALPNVNFRIESAADFNADGKTDIVWRDYSTGKNALWLMNGTTVTSVVDLPALPNTQMRIDALGDYNADGKTDLVWRNYQTGANSLWLMNGTALQSVVDMPALVNFSYEIVGPR